MAAWTEPISNHLLAALPHAAWQRWLPDVESVDLSLGQVLYESGVTLSHVHFPTSAIVSLQHVMEDGAPAEIAVVGNEGIVGISIFMAGESTPGRAAVRSPGRALLLPAQAIEKEFERSSPVSHLLLLCTQALISQMAQIAACNRHHSLHQQLRRLLLLSLDRLTGGEHAMTKELIANPPGVRRERVTAAALKVQKAGLIRYARGHISVLDRVGLELRSGECDAAVKNEYGRLLPDFIST